MIGRLGVNVKPIRDKYNVKIVSPPRPDDNNINNIATIISDDSITYHQDTGTCNAENAFEIIGRKEDCEKAQKELQVGNCDKK